MEKIKSTNKYGETARYTDEFKSSVSFLHSIMGVPTDDLVLTYGISDVSVYSWTKKYPAQLLESNLPEKTKRLTEKLEEAYDTSFIVVHEDKRQIVLFCQIDKKKVKELLEKTGLKASSLNKVNFTETAGTFITLKKNSRNLKHFLEFAENDIQPESRNQELDCNESENEKKFDAADEIQEETELDDETNYEELRAFYNLNPDEFNEETNKNGTITDLRRQSEPGSRTCIKVVPADPGLEKIRKLMIIRAFFAKNKIRPFKNNIDIGSSGFSFMIKKGLLNFRWTTEKIFRTLNEAGFDEAEVSLRCVWEHKKYFFSVYIPESCSAFGNPPIKLPENPFEPLP